MQFVLVVVVGATRMCSLVLEMVMELDMITNIIYQVHKLSYVRVRVRVSVFTGVVIPASLISSPSPIRNMLPFALQRLRTYIAKA